MLIAQAEAGGYDLLISADQDIPHQQNLSRRTISILVLTSNRWPLIRPYVETIRDAVNLVGSGDYVEIDIRPLPPGANTDPASE